MLIDAMHNKWQVLCPLKGPGGWLERAPHHFLPPNFFLDFFISVIIFISMKHCKRCKTPIEKPSYCAPCKAAYQKEWQAKHPGYRTAAKRKWMLANADRAKARELYRYALRSGKITRKPCSVCGSENTEGHHTDYSKPLEVIWLCRTHHLEEHAKLKCEAA